MNIESIRETLATGLVIPACPLALDENRQWSRKHQVALTRYFADAGSGALAVGVHSTQFAIRDPGIDLYQPVLRLVSQVLESWPTPNHGSVLKIAGICGDGPQASREAEIANELAYQAGLLSLGGLNRYTEPQLLEHCHAVSKLIPIIGFYLQPAVGGRVLSYEFWRKFCDIQNVVAIKIAPFNRYQTWDVVRAVIQSERDDISLYTGNDDNIIVDLLTPFSADVAGESRTRFIDGGLLGQWGVGTRAAVAMLESIKVARQSSRVACEWLAENVFLTDANSAIFDAANHFAGCIPGILEVLLRQGLVPSRCCLDEQEVLSPGQAEQISRVIGAYPHLLDNGFVRENLNRWLDS